MVWGLHDNSKNAAIIFTTLLGIFTGLLIVSLFGGIAYDSNDIVVVAISNFSAMIFGFYSTTIIGTDESGDPNPGSKHPNYLCILIAIIVSAIFLFTALLIYYPAYSNDLILKTWTAIFLFYGLELLGTVLGPLIGAYIH